MCHSFPHSSHTVKETLPRGRMPIPNRLTISVAGNPLRTKRADMIPQHCRQGRDLGTILIRQEFLSGKILRGMQPIVVNCIRQHSVPSAASMCYLSWIRGTSILAFYQCFVTHGWWLFFPVGFCQIVWSTHSTSSLVHISHWVMADSIVLIHTRLALILPAGLCAFTHPNVLLKTIYWYLSTVTVLSCALSWKYTCNHNVDGFSLYWLIVMR